MFKKGEHKLHREMDIGHLLKNIRDSKQCVKSYSRTRVFNPPNLFKEYQTHYANTLQISLNTLDSIEEEYAIPIPVDYIDPTPVCVCPDLGEENMFKITNAALETLKANNQVNQLIEQQNRKRQNEGGFSDKTSHLSRSLLNSSGKRIKSDDIIDSSTKKGRDDPISIMHPEDDKDKSKKSDIVSPSAASRKSTKSPAPAPAPPAKKDKKKDKKEKEKKEKKKDKEKDKEKDKKKKSGVSQEKASAKKEEQQVTPAAPDDDDFTPPEPCLSEK